MAPRMEQALADVRSAMSQAGYAPGSYNLILTSYACPLTERMDSVLHGPQGCPFKLAAPRSEHRRAVLRARQGCPFKLAHAQYGRTEAVPQFAEALRGAATRGGAK